MLAAGQRHAVEISSVTHEGAGVARIDGMAVFVPLAVRGDLCEIELVKVLANHAVARLIKIIRPSEKRETPPCDKFGLCGGCNFLNISYQEELDLKKELVLQNLKKIGGVSDLSLERVIPSPEIYGYRNKAEFQFSKDPVNGTRCGFFSAGSHKIAQAYDCKIQNPAFNAAARAFSEYLESFGAENVRGTLTLRSSRSTGEIFAAVSFDCGTLSCVNHLPDALKAACPLLSGVSIKDPPKKAVRHEGKTRLIYGEKHLFDTLCSLKFRISPDAFYQINPPQAELVYEKAAELSAVSKNDTVLDLYCGIGTLTLFMSRLAKKAVGVEAVSQAVEDAKFNAEINHIKNAEFHLGDAGQTAETLLKKGLLPDIITVDPPRRGLDQKTISSIAALMPKKIVYISCHSATLARDVKTLAGRGFYPERLCAVDMFPRTRHVECVVLMSRVKE